MCELTVSCLGPVVPVLGERDRLDVGVEVVARRVRERDVAELPGVLFRRDRAAARDAGVAGGYRLEGYLPHVTSALTSLTRLDLRWNEISGGIPQEFGEMSSLRMLLPTDNLLTGRLPGTLGGLSALQRLDLSYNAFTGTIPAELGKLSSLEALGLHNNQLTGEIPPELSGTNKLRHLVLNDNRFVGALPGGGLARTRGRDQIHLAGNDIPDVFDGAPSNKGLDFKDDNVITGAQVLDRTTQVIEDTETEEFMRAVLRSWSSKMVWCTSTLRPSHQL